MNNVIEFNGMTTLDIDPDKVLKDAVGELECAIVLGYVKGNGEHGDGEEYFSSSYSDNRKILWLLERMKKFILDGGQLDE